MITLIVLLVITVVAVSATIVTTIRDGYRSVPQRAEFDRVTSPDYSQLTRLA